MLTESEKAAARRGTVRVYTKDGRPAWRLGDLL